MVKETNGVLKKEIGWTVTIAGSLFALLLAVGSVGWYARGQTAQIQAVEVKTNGMVEDFDKHCVQQRIDTDKVKEDLSELNIKEAAQTVMLTNINEKIK